MAWDIAARYGPYGEPAVLLDYGDSGLGKTTGLLRSFPRCIWMAPRGGLKPGIALCGYSPLQQRVQTIWDCFAYVQHLYNSCNGELERLWQEYDAIGVDDWSVIMERSAGIIKQRYSGWDVWTTLLDLVLVFRDMVRDMGLHCVITSHEMPPGIDPKTGQKYKGGPELPSKKHVRKLAHVADTTVRSSLEPGRIPHSGVWRCDPDDPDYHYKDRHNIACKVGPMNAGELLREAGYPIRRLPGCEWFDEAAETIAQGVLQKEGEPDLAAWRVECMRRAATNLLDMKVPEAHVLWVVQDGVDRAEIRINKRADVQRRLGFSPSGGISTAGGLSSSGILTPQGS